MHDSEPELVHFHEVGGLDALADVCGVALALEELGIDRVECSPIPCSRGFVDASHGRLPLPAPATLELLRGAPLVPLELGVELVTPTGAALLAATVERYGAMPRDDARGGRLRRRHPRYAAGAEYRARARRRARRALDRRRRGDRDRDEPRRHARRARARRRRARVRRRRARRVDDARADEEGPARRRAGRARAAGRRPRRGRGDRARDDGARRAHVAPRAARARAALPRRHASAATRVRVKLGLLDGEVVNLAPEHDDCARAAEALGRPVKSVWAAALAAAEAGA